MNILHRALLSIRHFWKRTVVVLLIFTCIFTAVFIVFLTWNSSKNQIECLQRYLGNSITILKVMQEESQTPSRFTVQDIEAIKGIDAIENINVITTEIFLLKDVKPYVADEETYQAYKKKLEKTWAALGIEDAETNCRLYAMTDSEKMPFFTGSGFELLEGRAISSTDSTKKVALISKQLADTNHLKLGDSITVSLDKVSVSLGANSEELTLEIIGIFSSPGLQQKTERVDEYPANYIFVPESILKDTYKIPPEIVYGYTSNSSEIPKIIDQLNTVLLDGTLDLEGNPAVYKYNWDLEWVTSVSQPLTEVNRLSYTILMIIGFVMLILIAIIGALLIYKRTYEYYIYQSRGESKRRIICQSLLEYLLIILVSTILAFGLSIVALKPINAQIMKPYVSLYNTYLQEYKDKEELAGETVNINNGLRENSASIRNLNQNIPLHIDLVYGMVLLGILFILIPIILALEIYINLRGNSIRLNASSERS